MSQDIPREQPILDPGKYRPLAIVPVPAFDLILVDPDTLNEIGRDMGLPVQAGALTNHAGGQIYLRWPPQAPRLEDGTKNPKYEYGMEKSSIERALGYEVLSNWLSLDYDPLGR